ncbi:MAG TPA: hypothetical protein VNE40_04665 [Candidatus Dormibacteraeota bacterium]|nr:hypothetical protein [Candidatus Dormibacteraeota bacterium]
MTRVPDNPDFLDRGPDNNDWFSAADDSPLFGIIYRVESRPIPETTFADGVLKHIDRAEQDRWNRFKAQQPIDLK